MKVIYSNVLIEDKNLSSPSKFDNLNNNLSPRNRLDENIKSFTHNFELEVSGVSEAANLSAGHGKVSGSSVNNTSDLAIPYHLKFPSNVKFVISKYTHSARNKIILTGIPDCLPETNSQPAIIQFQSKCLSENFCFLLDNSQLDFNFIIVDFLHFAFKFTNKHLHNTVYLLKDKNFNNLVLEAGNSLSSDGRVFLNNRPENIKTGYSPRHSQGQMQQQIGGPNLGSHMSAPMQSQMQKKYMPVPQNLPSPAKMSLQKNCSFILENMSSEAKSAVHVEMCKLVSQPNDLPNFNYQKTEKYIVFNLKSSNPNISDQSQVQFYDKNQSEMFYGIIKQLKPRFKFRYKMASFVDIKFPSAQHKVIVVFLMIPTDFVPTKDNIFKQYLNFVSGNVVRSEVSKNHTTRSVKDEHGNMFKQWIVHLEYNSSENAENEIVQIYERVKFLNGQNIAFVCKDFASIDDKLKGIKDALDKETL